MVSLRFAIPFKFFPDLQKVVINSFCYFLFLNYDKNELSQVARLIPKGSLKFFKNDWWIFRKTLQK